MSKKFKNLDQILGSKQTSSSRYRVIIRPPKKSVETNEEHDDASSSGCWVVGLHLNSIIPVR